jgi:CheY-like chemotaxis protein
MLMAAAVALLDVLLVDDDAGDAMMVEDAFSSHEVPARLHVVVDGVEALAFLRREADYSDAPRPHLILLDLNMPRMGGREVLSLVKQDLSLRTIPIVVLTTSAAADDIAASYGLRAAAYVTKPIDFDDFTTAIHRIKDFYGSLVEHPREGVVNP